MLNTHIFFEKIDEICQICIIYFCPLVSSLYGMDFQLGLLQAEII